MSQCLNPTCLRTNPPTANFCQFCRSKLRLVERYRATKILGQGGFGRTFLAVDELKPSHPKCVIKQLLPQAQGTNNASKAAELFEQEAEQLETLGKHPQSPELYAYFTQDEQQYLVQEFIDGDNLQQELDAKGAYNEQQIRELLRDMLTVLQFVHSKNVIHRDIKPENIIRRRSDGKLVLVDFGAAKVEVNPNLSVTGTVIGSAEYTAPEQARGKAKFASDLYSLGVTCIHLLTQISPFDLFDPGEGDWVWRDYLVDNPVSDELGEVLDKLIESATKRRYQNVEEVLAIISPQQMPQPPRNSTPVQTPPPLTPQPVTPPRGTAYTTFEVVTVNRRGQISSKATRQAGYYTETLRGGVELDMVAIPGGSFIMGAPASEAESHESERPQRQVTLSPFYMSKYPITQAQYQAIMGNNPSQFKGNNRPVENVSWNNAVEFCKKLSQTTGKDYRLPSEAQWEYACRAGTTTPFHFGETITTDLANYNSNETYREAPKGKYREQTTDVGSFSPNAFGLYDMHGNVWEWCENIWHDNYNCAPTDGSTWNSGEAKDTGVLRGGSWYSIPLNCRSANRDFSWRGFSFNHLGFRVVYFAPRTF
jgi:formylglycine-generating enzyme required for sulfatase activity/predicted Ser/Thr protein kinase